MMTSYVPIPIPDKDPDVCPQCGKEEDIKAVCKHCGYEYPDEEDSGSSFPEWLIIPIALVGAWLVLTVGFWVLENAGEYGSAPTFVEVLKSQWAVITQLRIW
jgi:hypothetical protein